MTDPMTELANGDQLEQPASDTPIGDAVMGPQDPQAVDEAVDEAGTLPPVEREPDDGNPPVATDEDGGDAEAPADEDPEPQLNDDADDDFADVPEGDDSDEDLDGE